MKNYLIKLGRQAKKASVIPVSSKKKDKVLKEYNKKDKDLRLLAYQILVDKFNKKYKIEKLLL